MSLLITAFGRFQDGPNCSEAVLKALRADRSAVEAVWEGQVAFARLPVDTETIARALARALGRAKPSHVLLMGQAACRDGLSFEQVARNRRDFKVPDAAGRLGPFGPVRSGGPDQRRASWPRLVSGAAAIAKAGVPAWLSSDAGTHLCNQTLYLALEAAERADPPLAVTFLHIPLIAEQVAAEIPAVRERPNRPAMPLDEIRRAVLVFLRHTRRAAVRSEERTPR